MQDNHISDPRTRRLPRCAGPGGKPVEYSGVTVLDLAPEAVARLRTYYDSAVFGTGSP